MVDNDTAYHCWAQALSDDEWCDFLAGTPMLGRTPPPLPPEEFQRAWVGNAGVDTFREAIAFCRLLNPRCQRPTAGFARIAGCSISGSAGAGSIVYCCGRRRILSGLTPSRNASNSADRRCPVGNSRYRLWRLPIASQMASSTSPTFIQYSRT